MVLLNNVIYYILGQSNVESALPTSNSNALSTSNLVSTDSPLPSLNPQANKQQEVYGTLDQTDVLSVAESSNTISNEINEFDSEELQQPRVRCVSVIHNQQSETSLGITVDKTVSPSLENKVENSSKSTNADIFKEGEDTDIPLDQLKQTTKEGECNETIQIVRHEEVNHPTVNDSDKQSEPDNIENECTASFYEDIVSQKDKSLLRVTKSDNGVAYVSDEPSQVFESKKIEEKEYLDKPDDTIQTFKNVKQKRKRRNRREIQNLIIPSDDVKAISHVKTRSKNQQPILESITSEDKIDTSNLDDKDIDHKIPKDKVVETKVPKVILENAHVSLRSTRAKNKSINAAHNDATRDSALESSDIISALPTTGMNKDGLDENATKQIAEETPLKSSRRGRKRKLSIETHKTPNMDCVDQLKSTPLKIKIQKRVSKEPETLGIRCGKCINSSDTYLTQLKFKDHAIREHGGLAKPLGESQEYSSEEELFAALKEVFSTKRQIPCYQCMQKKFTSFGGLKMHLLTCGKTKEECDVSTGRSR